VQWVGTFKYLWLSCETLCLSSQDIQDELQEAKEETTKLQHILSYGEKNKLQHIISKMNFRKPMRKQINFSLSYV
jgi:hypothetical protein